MLKIIAITIIFLSSTYLGNYYGDTFKKRYRQLNCILKSVMYLNNEVIYSNTPLPEALKYVSIKVEEPVKSILLNVSLKLEGRDAVSVYEAFKSEYMNNKESFNLREEDKVIVKDFLKGLGESAVYGQDKLFNLTIENMKISCKLADDLAKKNSKMYRAIGICFGAMIAIFLF